MSSAQSIEDRERPAAYAGTAHAGATDGAWRDVVALVGTRRRTLVVGLLLILAGRLAGAVLPATSKFLVDDVIGRGERELLPLLVAAALLAACVQAAASFVVARMLGNAAYETIADLRKRVEHHVLRLPVAYFNRTTTGALVSRIMHDADGVRNLVGTGLVQFLGGLVTAGIAFAVLLHLNWRLTLVIGGLFATGALLLFVALRRVRPLYLVRAEINARASGRLAEALGGIRVVKAYAAEDREDQAFATAIDRGLQNLRQTVAGVSATTAMTTLAAGAIGSAIMFIGGRAVLGGSMTLGDFVMYVFFTGVFAAPLLSIAAVGTQLTEAFAGLERLRQVLNEQPEANDDPAREPVHDVRGQVEFRDVWFEYDEGRPVLRGVSFEAAEGTTTALVGSSGSGKSTILALIMAFMRPASGRVLVDGRDLSALRIYDYRSHLGVVLQENFLFDGTIAENLLYGRPSATRDEMLAAARVAHVDEFVEPLTSGYETVIGERGIRLSGGQRQRVAIARAILADPAILILDEATSSLDSDSEAKIQDALRALRRGRTTFVIAHRLSTIRGADQILVIEGGAVVERGTHESLLALSGRYREVYDRQAHVGSNRFVNPGEVASVRMPAGDSAE